MDNLGVQWQHNEQTYDDVTVIYSELLLLSTYIFGLQMQRWPMILLYKSTNEYVQMQSFNLQNRLQLSIYWITCSVNSQKTFSAGKKGDRT